MKSEGILLNLFLPRTRGACVAHFRHLLQLKQIEISKELGMNRSSISKMENGDMNVSENVWSYVLKLVYLDYGLENSIPFLEFRHTLEHFLKDEDVISGGQVEWTERKLSWQPETSI
jgi:transcriptional regulator with XRE-family HTH domain